MNAPHPNTRAWVEVDTDQLEHNFQRLVADMPPSLAFGSVVKDEAYGHGASRVAQVALRHGAALLYVSNVAEGIALREDGHVAPITVFGERDPSELEAMAHWKLTPVIGSRPGAEAVARLARELGRPFPAYLEVDTGMGRWGFHWRREQEDLVRVVQMEALQFVGIDTHFPMSDESDKTFALHQIDAFHQTVDTLETATGRSLGSRSLCNTGGYLDLPSAHADRVRLGILPLGVWPSKVCRRIEGIRPVLSVRARVARVNALDRGDNVGYGLRYQAPEPRRIAVLPIGYGDGMPRLRNAGHVLIHGRRAPIVGGNAMDATMVDVTDIPDTQAGSIATLLGTDGEASITVHEVAAWKGTVSYEVLTAWRARLPRVEVSATP